MGEYCTTIIPTWICAFNCQQLMSLHAFLLRISPFSVSHFVSLNNSMRNCFPTLKSQTHTHTHKRKGPIMTSSNGNIFPRYWPFVRGIHRSPVNSTHKGQWSGAMMFSLICAWIKVWVNNREAGDLRSYRAHYDVTVMYYLTDNGEDHICHIRQSLDYKA